MVCPENIILIGMPGAGKSTLGVLLAKTLGKSFVDTDILIQQKEGRLLQEIINESGVAAFLGIEEKVILEMNPANSVIATGGSVIYSDLAMNHLKNKGIVVYLRVGYPDLKERITNMGTRGIVMQAGQQLIDLYHERTPYYEKYADLVIDSSVESLEETLDTILKSLTY